MSVHAVYSIFFKDWFYTIYGDLRFIDFDLNQPDTFSTTALTAFSTPPFIKASRAYSAYSG